MQRAGKLMNEIVEKYDSDDFREALSVLRAGGVILYPTDTVWGIGCDATNPEAVERIYSIKRRSDSKAMLCLLDAPGKLQGYVKDIPSIAWDLIDCATRPLTLIYPKGRNLAHNLLAEDGSIGIRITNELFSKKLCEALHAPLVSTSANVSGEPAARNFGQITPHILSSVDYVVRYRRNDVSEPLPSSIIKIGEGNVFHIIRA